MNGIDRDLVELAQKLFVAHYAAVARSPYDEEALTESAKRAFAAASAFVAVYDKVRDLRPH